MQVSLSKLSWKAQAGVFLAVSVLAVGGFYKYYVEPMQAEMAIREKKLAGLRVDINKGLATARRLAEFRKQVAEFETRLDALRAVLPEEKDVGDLLRRLQMLAAQANLQIKGFKPAPIVVKQMHAEWPINLQLEGTYHNLGHFFDEVGKFSRIININAIHIKSKDKSPTGATISADCVATTFVMTEAPAKPAARPRPVRPATKKAD
jgi:type IV pilus assembly protein PilO